MKDEGIQSIREKTKPFSPLFRFSLLGEFVSERKHHDPILFHDNNNKAIASSGNAIKVSTGKKVSAKIFLETKVSSEETFVSSEETFVSPEETFVSIRENKKGFPCWGNYKDAF